MSSSKFPLQAPERSLRPLLGKSMVVTRAPHQAEELCTRIREYEARPLLYPCIDIEPPSDCSALDQGIKSVVAGHFDWLIFTSSNTALSVAKRCAALRIPTTSLASASIAVVGEATAESVQKMLGIPVDFIPKDYLADALAETLPRTPNMRVFLPQANLARSVLADTLIQAGANVDTVVAYQTVCGQGGDPIPELLQHNQIDVITFTSPSTVRNFFARIRNEGFLHPQLPPICIACIGSVTAETATSMDLAVQVVPKLHTLDQLLKELADYYRQQTS